MVFPRSVRVRLTDTILATGFIALQSTVELLIRTTKGFEPLQFLIDPGAVLTTIPASFARELGIPLPLKSTNLRVRTAGGTVWQKVYPVHLRVRIPAFAGREFVWPCHFVEPSTGAADSETLSRALLGLGGVLNDLRIIFDGGYALDAPHGCVILEEVSRSS